MTFEDKIKRLMVIVNKGDLDAYGWHLVQLNEKEAMKLHDSQMQKDMTDSEIVNIQLFQFRKCSPRFFEALWNNDNSPTSFLALIDRDLRINAHLNLPNNEKYNFTAQECLDWVKIMVD